MSIAIGEGLLGQGAVIELIDATGRPALVQRIVALAASNAVNLPPALPQGLYLLRMHTAQQEWLSARVVVQR